MPTSETGTPLIATNCIKDDQLYPTFEKVRYVDDETMQTWFRAHLKSGDILFVNKGTPGRVALVPDPVTFCAAQDMMGLRVNPAKINNEYLFAILRSYYARKFIENNHVGLVIPHFRKQELKTLMIPLPAKPLQKAIGDMYVGISKKIDLNNRINAELESLARTIYDYWFLQFDFPDGAGRPYRSSGGEMRFDEELGREVPVGWSSARIGDKLARVQRTEKINRDDYSDSGTIPIIDQSRNYIAGYTDNPLSKIENEHGVVVFGDHTRVVKYVQFDFARGADGTQVMFSDDPRLPASLFYQKINSIDLSNYGYARHYKFLKDVQIVIPSEDIASLYSKVVTPLWNKISSGIKENAELSSLRDWLLPLLMSGEVVVGE